ncbi:hypothetical protein D3C80_1737600 [compost metagenome]
MSHQFRASGNNGKDIVDARQHAYQAGSRTQRGFSSHANRTRSAMIAANNHQLAVIAFVRCAAARRQPRLKLIRIQPCDGRFLSGKPAFKSQRVVMKFSHHIARFAGQ